MQILKQIFEKSLTFFCKFLKFNSLFYRAAYPDIAHLSPIKIQLHYLRYGLREGRISSWSELKRKFERKGLKPQLFNPIVYLALNPELQILGVHTQEAGAIHFLNSGYSQGLQADVLLPKFLDSKNNLQFLEKGWSQLKDANSMVSNKIEKTASEVFQDSLEAQLRKFDSEAFAHAVYSRYLGFLPELSSFDIMVSYLDSGLVPRVQFLIDVANSQRNVREFGLEPSGVFATNSVNDFVFKQNVSTETISIMGIDVMAKGEWFTRAYKDEEVRYFPELDQIEKKFTPPAKNLHPFTKPKVSVLCSMYRTDEHLVAFLNGLRSQSIFSQAEFILVLVEPSEYEIKVCTEFANTCSNIILQIIETRVGIYEAWNIAAKMSNGTYLTNMNVDDVRRSDSLEKQLEIFERFDWADVVYQDVLISLDPRLPWNQIMKINAQLRVEKSSTVTFSSYRNPPHNGPMWKKSLHEELGFFDQKLVSAGDYDFWFRCAVAGKNFFNVTDPHVGYFINPEGLSTKKDSKGTEEGRSVVLRNSHSYVREHCPQYISDFNVSVPVARAERLTLGVIEFLVNQHLISQEK